MNEEKKITFYGAGWCPDCRNARHILEVQGCIYEYIDIEKSEEAREHIAGVNKGKPVVPTIEIDGDVLVNPGQEELLGALGVAERCKEELYDLRVDPYELKNIADAPAHQATRVALRKQLLDICKQQGDTLEVE